MRVYIETIPQEKQRIPGQVADWIWIPPTTAAEVWKDDYADSLWIHVSDLGDWRKEMCLAYHELFEALECKARGISAKAVDDFDRDWKEHDGIDEEGNDPAAPYYEQHQHATVAERHLANCLGVNWTEYDRAIEVTLALNDGQLQN